MSRSTVPSRLPDALAQRRDPGGELRVGSPAPHRVVAGVPLLPAGGFEEVLRDGVVLVLLVLMGVLVVVVAKGALPTGA